MKVAVPAAFPGRGTRIWWRRLVSLAAPDNIRLAAPGVVAGWKLLELGGAARGDGALLRGGVFDREAGPAGKF